MATRNTQQLNLTLSHEQRRRVRQAAEAAGVSESQFIRLALSLYVTDWPADPPPPGAALAAHTSGKPYLRQRFGRWIISRTVNSGRGSEWIVQDAANSLALRADIEQAARTAPNRLGDTNKVCPDWLAACVTGWHDSDRRV